jgi:GT2 family glycosyltransferase
MSSTDSSSADKVINTVVNRVSIIIVNLNGEPYLERCLSTLLAQTYSNFEVVLVDNGSTDTSVALVRERFPSVRVIETGQNLGLPRAINVGIRSTDSDYVVTLNNDTWVEPDWLAALVEVMEQDAQIGICASKMLFAHRPDVINSAGVCVNLAGIAWDRLGGSSDSALDDATPQEVFAACSGAALYRRTMLDEVGLFDEDYFIYLDDVDLSWRARLMGWRCMVAPRSRVYHVHSATTSEGSPFKNFLLGRNKVWTVVKNYPAPHFWLYLPVILFYDLGSALYALIARGNTATLRGRLAALRSLPAIWRKRRAVQARRRVSFAELSAHMSRLESPPALLRRFQHLRSLPVVASRLDT